MMKNSRLIFCAVLLAALGGAAFARAQSIAGTGDPTTNSQFKEKRVLYFDPEVYPDMQDIKEPTNTAFFSAVSDNISAYRNSKMLRAETPLEFDNPDAKTVSEYCKNNDADYAVVPMVKYFKVGLGRYIFSNQVVVSMKLFDANGTLLTESSYDTYRKNIRLLGSAENSVKIGTKGAIRDLVRAIRQKKNTGQSAM